MGKTISIDWDDTYTADPETFAGIVEDLREAGHQVGVITRRYDTIENRIEISKAEAEFDFMLFAGAASKQEAAEAAGITVDIWIDDKPQTIAMILDDDDDDDDKAPEIDPQAAARYADIDFSPPQGVREEAARGLEWRREHGRGGTEVGVARARDLSNGRNVSPETINRMQSFFARHAGNEKAEGWSPGEPGFPSNGRIAWALWGGDPGKSWAAKITKQMDARDKPKAQGDVMKTEKTIRIDSVIGTGPREFSAARMAAFLEEADGAPIHAVIHSEGGSVHEGMAIHDMIEDYGGPKRATIQSMAFSIASFIPLAFDRVDISPNGWFMIHNPSVDAAGDDDDLAKIAGMVRGLKDKMIDGYAARLGQPRERVEAMMKQETFFDAQEAVEMGLATAIAGNAVRSPRAINGMAKLPHGVVTALFGSPTKPKEEVMTVERQPATARAIKQALPRAKSDFVVRCMEKEMTLDEVKDEYMQEVEQEAVAMEDEKSMLMEAKAALESELEEMKAKLAAMEEAAAQDKTPSARYAAGVKAVANRQGAATSVSAKSAWQSAVKAKMTAGMNRERAILTVDREEPELRAAFLAEING